MEEAPPENYGLFAFPFKIDSSSLRKQKETEKRVGDGEQFGLATGGT